MSARVAAIDLGTNTFHLIIAEVEDNTIKQVLLAEQKHVKLGEGGINKGLITEEAFARGIAALIEFNDIIFAHNVQHIAAVGTAALRTAKNGSEFIRQVKEKTGIQIEIIEGDREASLIYAGVKQAVFITENSLIMDIGGGSVEFILADAAGVLWKRSYPIGAAKLMATFHHSDPISQIEIREIHSHLDNLLSDLRINVQSFKPRRLIGSAGAFETFQALSSKDTRLNKTSYQFDMEDLTATLNKIIASDHKQREQDNKIIPVRVDMIVVASILTQYIIETLNIKSVEVSSYALKEGLLLSAVQ